MVPTAYNSLPPSTLRSVLPWAPNCTDPSKLRSLLLNPTSPVQLFLQPCTNSSSGCFAITRAKSVQGDDTFTIYGNLLQHSGYEYACEHIIGMSSGRTCRLSALPAPAVPAVRAVFKEHGFTETYSSPCWQYTLQGCLLEQLRDPGFTDKLKQQLCSQYELSTLRVQDADLVNSLWAYRGASSLDMIKQLITHTHNSCIRTAPDGQLVSWMLETDLGMAGMLHTLQHHRRKGLAKIVLLDLLHKLERQHQQQTVKLCKLLQQKSTPTNNMYKKQPMNDNTNEHKHTADPQHVPSQGMNWPGGSVYAYVVWDNVASLALFDCLGMVKSGEFWWVGYELPGRPCLNGQ